MTPFDPAELARRVGAEMEAVFDHGVVGPSPPVATVPERPAPRRFAGLFGRARPQTVGAVAAAGLAGLAVGSLLEQPRLAPAPPEAASRATAGLKGGLAAFDGGPAPLGPATLDELRRYGAAAGEAQAAAPAVAPRAALPAAAASAPAPRTSRTSAASPEKPRAIRARCRGKGASRCLHRQMLEADRRLRRAYARAIRTGAPRRVLVAYQREWASVRRRSRSSPAEVVYRYNLMADRLTRELRRSETGAARAYAWNR